jgi:uncharacterized membrane protein
MWILILGLVVFFSIHSVRMAAGGFRERQMAISPSRWKAIYVLFAAIGLALIIWGWILYRADAAQFYEPPSWGRHVAMVAVWIAFVLAAAAQLPAGRLKAYLKHPFLAAVILWSAAHLLANGDLASVSVFGAFLAFAVVNRLAVIPRGDPAPAVLQPRSDLIAVLAGTAIYAVFLLWLHSWLFGVSPLA